MATQLKTYDPSTDVIIKFGDDLIQNGFAEGDFLEILPRQNGELSTVKVKLMQTSSDNEKLLKKVNSSNKLSIDLKHMNLRLTAKGAKIINTPDISVSNNAINSVIWEISCATLKRENLNG